MKYITDRNFLLNNTCVTLGKFDGLHKGHMLLIDKTVSYAKANNLKSVLFTFDMPRKTIYSQSRKEELIQQTGVDVCVVYPFDEMTCSMKARDFVEQVLIKQLGVKKIIVGQDYRFGHNRKGNITLLKEYAKKYHFEVEAVEKLQIDESIVSSTLIKKMMSQGDMEQIKKYLGRNYDLEGIVTAGKQIGRTIGFPTANIIPEPGVILPRFGVYKTKVYIDDVIKDGITNIGCRPTVKGTYVSVETYIGDFDDNIYDKKIKVEFIKFIRPERKFESVEELKEQINQDICQI